MDDLDCIVLCGGKCGSTTLSNTLTNNNFKNIKVHNKADFYNQFNYDGLIDTININLNKNLNKKFYIFDSYRTPIERKISSFFQNIDSNVGINYINYSIEALINIFNDKYINTLEEHSFINEILDEYNIEHFTYFDFEKRYNVIEKENLVIIKLLFKDIKMWALQLSEILGKEITLYSDNISEHKEYYHTYMQFKKKYRVPKSYIDNNLKNNKEFKIFNTEEEQEIYIERCNQEFFFE
jgi:hypothetical protein